jgi:hypothetical protein
VIASHPAFDGVFAPDFDVLNFLLPVDRACAWGPFRGLFKGAVMTLAGTSACISFGKIFDRAQRTLAAAFLGGLLLFAVTAPLATPASALSNAQAGSIIDQARTAGGFPAGGLSDQQIYDNFAALVAQLQTQYSGDDLVEALGLMVYASRHTNAAGIAAQVVIDKVPATVAGEALGWAAMMLYPTNKGQADAIASKVGESGNDDLIVAFVGTAPLYAYLAFYLTPNENANPPLAQDKGGNYVICKTPSCT